MFDNPEDTFNKAQKIFNNIPYKASNNEINNLASNISLLENRGLGKLNLRLEQSKPRNIWDTFSEHNFASMLVSCHNSNIPIHYEEPGEGRHPDFKIVIGQLTYWIQMKRLSELERENRQDKIMYKIELETKKIKISKFFGCLLSQGFTEGDIPNFIDFISQRAEKSIKEEKYFFPNNKEPKAKVYFWPKLSGIVAKYDFEKGFSNGDTIFEWLMQNDYLERISDTEGRLKVITGELKTALAKKYPDSFQVILAILQQSLYLKCDSCDDMENMIDETGLVEEQINGCLRNAVGAFKGDVDQHTINLVVMDGHLKEDTEICNAVFGTEAVISRGNQYRRIRKNDGFFNSSDFLKRVAGVIVMKGKERRTPVFDYFYMLFINANFKDRLNDISKLLPLYKVVYPNIRPSGKGNFDSA